MRDKSTALAVVISFHLSLLAILPLYYGPSQLNCILSQGDAVSHALLNCLILGQRGLETNVEKKVLSKSDTVTVATTVSLVCTFDRLP
jgi:hypothetical protein